MKTKTTFDNWSKLTTKQLLQIDFVRFFMVGTVGFVVTAALLRFFHVTLKLDIIPATLLSCEGGLLSNFLFHQNWTYKKLNHQSKPIATKLAHFHMSTWSGILLITIIETFCVKVLHLNYLLSLAIAAGITMFWNYFWTRYFIFKGNNNPVVLRTEKAVSEIKQA